MKTRDQLRDLVGRTRDWLTGDGVSGFVLCVMLDQQLYSLQKTHYRQQGQVCKAGTVITVDASSEERTSSSRDWLTGYDVRGRVLLSWPVG